MAGAQHDESFDNFCTFLPALLESGSEGQRARATEAVRNALAANIGPDGGGLGAGLWLVSAIPEGATQAPANPG